MTTPTTTAEDNDEWDILAPTPKVKSNGDTDDDGGTPHVQVTAPKPPPEEMKMEDPVAAAAAAEPPIYMPELRSIRRRPKDDAAAAARGPTRTATQDRAIELVRVVRIRRVRMAVQQACPRLPRDVGRRMAHELVGRHRLTARTATLAVTRAYGHVATFTQETAPHFDLTLREERVVMRAAAVAAVLACSDTRHVLDVDPGSDETSALTHFLAYTLDDLVTVLQSRLVRGRQGRDGSVRPPPPVAPLMACIGTLRAIVQRWMVPARATLVRFREAVVERIERHRRSMAEEPADDDESANPPGIRDVEMCID